MSPIHLLHVAIHPLKQCHVAAVHLLHELSDLRHPAVRLLHPAVHTVEEFVGSLVSVLDDLSKLAPGHAPIPDREDPHNEPEKRGSSDDVCPDNQAHKSTISRSPARYWPEMVSLLVDPFTKMTAVEPLRGGDGDLAGGPADQDDGGAGGGRIQRAQAGVLERGRADADVTGDGPVFEGHGDAAEGW